MSRRFHATLLKNGPLKSQSILPMICIAGQDLAPTRHVFIPRRGHLPQHPR